MRDTIPVIVGALPFGIIFGTLAHTSGLSAAGAVAMSALVYAGSAQFIALGLLATGTGWPLIVLTTLVVNLRHLLYAMTFIPLVRSLSQWWKIPLAFLLTDETFAVVAQRFRQKPQEAQLRWYYLGSAMAMFVSWQLFTWLGLVAGQAIPNLANLGLDFAMLVTFIGMVIPYLSTRPMWASVITAGSVAVLTRHLPHQLGLIVATISAVGVALALDLYLNGRPTPALSGESYE